MGKYDRWDWYFRELTRTEHVMDFQQLEALIDGSLPPSAYNHSVWWLGPHYYAKWRQHGWYAHPDLQRRLVRFDRKAPKRGRPAERPTSSEAARSATNPSGDRLILLRSVKTKLSHPAPAKDLFVSALWQKRRNYADVLDSLCEHRIEIGRQVRGAS